VVDKRRHTEVLQGAVALAGRRVVDVGCGGGALARWLAGQGAAVVGVDTQLRAARAARANGVAAAVASADALPLAAGAVDVVVVFNSLHHFPEPAAALAEARRVLAPAGVVYIAEPLAAGAYFSFMRPVDDETAERARALAALDAAEAVGLAVADTTDYAYDVIVRDLDSEIRTWLDVDPARAPRIDAARDELARRLSDHGIVTEKGHALEQPMRSWVLRPVRARTVEH
jgi:SAM-dependent methyltransferase